MPENEETGAAVIVTTQTPAELLAIAVSNNADVEKLAKLMDLSERWEAGQARKLYYAAMRDVQAKIPPVFKDAENTHTHSRYSTYDKVHQAIVPVYTEHGFSVSHNETDSPQEGHTRFLAICRHIGGHDETFSIDLPPDSAGAKGTSNKNAIQAKVSSSTYAKRTLEMRIFGVACTGDDDDGNGGEGTQMVSAMDAKEMGNLLGQLPEERRNGFFEHYGIGAVEEMTAKEANKALAELRAAVRQEDIENDEPAEQGELI